MKLNFYKDWIKSTTFNRKIIVILLFAIPLVLLVGFLLGRTKSENVYEKKLASLQKTHENQTNELKEEYQRIIEGRGLLVGEKEGLFDRSTFGFYSALLEDKSVIVRTYEYKTSYEQPSKTILQKRIQIDDNSGVEVWEYVDVNYPFKEPDDFVTFGGYENYTHKAISLEELRNSWEDVYITVEGMEMQYSYEYTPNTIGAVSLNTYYSTLSGSREAKPTVFRVWTEVEGFPADKGHPAVTEAKRELQDIVNTFEFGY